MFVLIILEKIKEMRLKFSQGSITIINIMGNYQEARVKLSNTLLKKLKSSGKSKAGLVLRLNKKKFEDEELSHELFLTRRQTTKTKNAFANNMLTDGKLTLANIAIPFARDKLNLKENKWKTKFQRRKRIYFTYFE